MTDEEKAAEARGIAKGLEMAAQLSEADGPKHDFGDGIVFGKKLHHRADLANLIRALHPDPSLLVVKREELERLRAGQTDVANAIIDAMLGDVKP